MRFSIASLRTPFRLDRTVEFATSILDVSIYLVSIYRIFTAFRFSHLSFLCIGISFAVYSQRESKRTIHRCIYTISASFVTTFTFTDTMSRIGWIFWNLLLFLSVFFRQIADRYRCFNIHLWDECLPCFE